MLDKGIYKMGRQNRTERIWWHSSSVEFLQAEGFYIRLLCHFTPVFPHVSLASWFIHRRSVSLCILEDREIRSRWVRGVTVTEACAGHNLRSYFSSRHLKLFCAYNLWIYPLNSPVKINCCCFQASIGLSFFLSSSIKAFISCCLNSHLILNKCLSCHWVQCS